MALNIKKISQVSGRAAQGFDSYAGMQFYGTAPSVTGKWKIYTSALFPAVEVKCEQIFSIQDAEDAGILPNTENIAGTATYLITDLGATGDTLKLTCLVPKEDGTTEIKTLCEYTVTSAETTIALQGAAATALINASTYETGFSSNFNTATITIIAPKNLGLYLNTGTPVAAAVTGDIDGTLTQSVIDGTVSQYAIWHYQISEFFRKSPNGILWIGIISATSNANEILALTSASGNILPLVGIYDVNVTSGIAANIVGTVAKYQTSALLIDGSFPLEVIYSPNIKSVTNLATMPNGQLTAYNKVSVITSQDGNAKGAYLFLVSGQTIGNLGLKLATLVNSRISSDDSQAIESNNLSDGTENSIPAFGNGQLLSAISVGLRAQLKSYRYIFFETFVGNITGTFWNENHCFCVQTNRYAYMNDNRVIDKLTRIMRTTYLPLVKSEVIYNTDGTIGDLSIESLQNAGVDAIEANMITGFGAFPLISGDPIITIDPSQELKKTNNLDIVVKIGENGIARNITIIESFSN